MADIKIRFGINEEDGTPVEIDKRYIDSLSSLSETTSDASSIKYGTLENSGNLVVYDRNDYIRNLIHDGIIQTEGTPLNIVVNGNTVQKHISADNTYDKNTKQLSMSLSNKMKEWSVLKFRGFCYPRGPHDSSSRTAYDVLYDVMYTLYGSVWTDTSIFDEMLSEDVIWGNDNYKTTIKEYMSSVVIEYPVIESNRTYRDVIDEFCNMLQLQCYITDDDKVKFVSARPVVDISEIKAIRIPLSSLYSDIEETIIPKNRCEGVELTEFVAKENFNINAPLFTFSEEVAPEWDGVDFDESQTVESFTQLSETLVNRVARVDTYYHSGQFSFPKSENMGLDLILGINVELINKNDTLTQHFEQSNVVLANNLTYDYEFDYISKSPIYYDAKDTSKEFNINLIPDLNTTFQEIKTTAPSVSITQGIGTASASLTDDTTFSFVEYEDSYLCSYKVLCGSLALSFIDTSTSSELYGGSVVGHVNQINIDKKLAERIKITVYGTKRQISFSSQNVSTDNISEKKNSISIPSGKLLQSNTLFDDGSKVSDNIKNTILSDFKKGVPDARFTVSCNNYYYKDGILAIDWSKGETFQNENIVFFDGDLDESGNQRYWKIVGRKFIYDNAPMLEVSVKNVSSIITSLASGLYDSTTKERLYTWQELIDIGYVKVEENGIRINIINDDGILVFPNNATSISSIRPSSRLFGLHIPSSFVGSFTPFSSLQVLEEIKVSKGNAVYDDSGKYNALIYKSANLLVLATRNTDLDVLSHVDVIRESAFSGCIKQQKTVVIPNNIQQIQMQAFSSCSFENFVFGYGNGTIYQNTLSNCQELKSVFIPNNIKTIYCPSVYDSPFLYSNKDAVIYCEAESAPSGWSEYWNSYDANNRLNVKYGYSLETYKNEVGI